MQDARDGKIKHLYVWKIDRLGRDDDDLVALQVYADLTELGEFPASVRDCG